MLRPPAFFGIAAVAGFGLVVEPLIPNCTKTDSDLGFPNGKKSDSMVSLAWRTRHGSID